uniref:Putative disease resistance gene NBS-LRR family protein n=1 Tax=Rhizophora mucronata TaxID=61149 RepID=A0A2P2JGR0_RHIMU
MLFYIKLTSTLHQTNFLSAKYHLWHNP